MQFVYLLHIAGRSYEHVHREAGMESQGKLKRHDSSEVNAMVAKTSIKALVSSIGLGGNYIFVIPIINVTLYYSAILANMYASSVRRVICTVHGNLAAYSQNTSEMISEGLLSKIFLRGGHAPTSPLWAHYAHTYVLHILLETFLPMSVHYFSY